MNRWLLIPTISLLSSVLVAQEKNVNPKTDVSSEVLVPLPPSAPAPMDNPTTPGRVELGKMLFFDPRLSGDNRMSCSTCHMPDKAFGDGLALSPGAGGKVLERHTQTCLNVAFFQTFFWDGRVSSLEEQALRPIESPVEMNQPLGNLEVELAQTKALAAFQRTLVTGPSPFDRFLTGEKDALTADARTGFELFRGAAGCIECHNGPLLSDGKFYRLGEADNDRGRRDRLVPPPAEPDGRFSRIRLSS